MGKKIILILLSVAVLIGALFFAVNQKNTGKLESEDNPYGDMNLSQSTIDQIGDKNYSNVILPEDLETLIEESEEDVVVYFFSPECIYCVQSTPLLMSASEEVGIEVYQYNLLEFEEGYVDYELEGTPTLVHFKDGEEVSRVFGGRSEEEYKTILGQIKQK